MVVVIMSIPLAVVALIPRLSPHHLCTAHGLRLGQNLTIRQHPLSSMLLNLLLAQQISLFDLAIIDQVQPVGKTVSALGNLQLDGGDGAVVVIGIQVIHGGQRGGAVGHDDCAHVGVGVARPGHGGVLRGVNRVSRNPVSGHAGVVTRVDLGDERVGPALGVGEGIATHEGLGHISIPVGVQIVRVALMMLATISPFPSGLATLSTYLGKSHRRHFHQLHRPRREEVE